MEINCTYIQNLCSTNFLVVTCHNKSDISQSNMAPADLIIYDVSDICILLLLSTFNIFFSFFFIF